MGAWCVSTIMAHTHCPCDIDYVRCEPQRALRSPSVARPQCHCTCCKLVQMPTASLMLICMANVWAMQAGEGLTAVRFDAGGLQCAVGTSNGLVALYDLRMSRPTAVRDHMYGQPILDIKFHSLSSSSGMPCFSPVRAGCCPEQVCCMHIPGGIADWAWWSLLRQLVFAVRCNRICAPCARAVALAAERLW